MVEIGQPTDVLPPIVEQPFLGPAVVVRSTFHASLRLTLALLIAALASPTPAMAEIDGCIITFFGTYTVETSHPERSTTSPTGSTIVSTGFRTERQTDQIQAVLGGRFGIEFVVAGRSSTGGAEIVRVRRFPSLRNPRTGGVFDEQRTTFEVRLGEHTWYGYIFEEEWEMQPGEWVFEIWDKQRQLCRQVFQITR